MGIMQKFLDMLNFERRNQTVSAIEEKEPKPENLFWDDEPEENLREDEKSEEFGQEKHEEYHREYEYKLFATIIDIPTIIGNREQYMRRDYTVDPKYNEYWRYLHRLWKCSVDLEKIVKAKKFFEILEEFEKLMETIESYRFTNFNPEKEKAHYYSKKDEILIKFLDRCFTDEYRNAIELKTVKGRINRIDHWFLMMNYYKYYLTPKSLDVLESLNKRWTGELMPNLLEKNN